VRIKIERPELPAPLLLVGEVVRHVTPNEAQAWNMLPGFAVQFVELSPEGRGAIGRIVEVLPGAAAPPTPAPTQDDPQVATVLDYFQKRVGANHYEFLGMPFDAEFAEVRSRARRMEGEVQALRQKP